jgi:hypothetical protein
MSRQETTGNSSAPDHSIMSKSQRDRIYSSIMSDKRFMVLEQIAMALLVLSLWLAVS